MHVHGARGGILVAAPDRVEQRGSIERATLVDHEEAQQIEFLLQEPVLFVPASQRMSRKVGGALTDALFS